MLRSGASCLLCSTAASVLFLAGCSTNPAGNTALSARGMSGSVHGGQQPISGASVQLYTVGTSGDGSASAPILNSSVVSDPNGNFSINGLYTCPSASTLVYLTATGGSPAPNVSNPQIALMASLGPCGSLTSSTFINVNEITTVAAVYALAPFMTSLSAIGSGPSDAAALTSAFTYAGYFADTSTGETPGPSLPPGYSVPVAQINTIANLIAACVNSSGGVSGDTSVCGTIFALTPPLNGAAPTNTVAALLNLANNPTLHTAALYNLIPPVSPFQPIQPIVPPDFALRLVANSAFVVSPSAVTFAPAVVNFTQSTQTVTVTNGTSAGVNITSTSITGVSASDFAVVPQPGSDCAITVPANTTCTYQISFTPSAAGGRAAYFILANTSANPSIAIALSGSGAAGSAGPVTLTPSSLAFTQLGIPQTLTLTNSGATPLSINAINISNSAYTQTNNCGSSLPASSSCSINVSVPGPLTAASATLTVVDDAASGPQTASLTFSGTAGASFPPLVDFGHWAIGATGTEFLAIGGPGVYGTFNFTITGPNTTDFSFDQNSSLLSTSCSYENRFESPCTIHIYYKPSALITSLAYVNIAGVGRFTLTGTGDPAGVDFDLYQAPTPTYNNTYAPPITSLNLGKTPLGTSVTSVFAIQNTGTVSPLSINAPVLSGPNAGEFTVTAPSCSSGCSPAVTFTPAGTGTRSATLTYTDTSNAVTRTLSLTGVGTTPVPVLTAATNLYFSNVPIGTVSASQTITVKSYANHPIQASLTPTYSGGPQPFIFTGPTFCASTPCTLSIAYAPTSATSGDANVYVVATDTVGLSSGNIQAYGQVAPLADVSFNTMSLAFPSQAINTVSAPQTVTFTNTGTTVLMLTFSLTDTGSASDFLVDNHCPTSLAINATCTVGVSFAPVAAGYPHTNLEIYGANVTRYVDLTGTTP